MTSLPMLRVPTCFHVGTLDPAARKPSSYEGSGLSVSTCPVAWQRIARLGAGLFALKRPDALFLDARALVSEVVAEVRAWAVENGLAEPRKVWRLYDWDEEAEEWRYGEFPTRDAALAEADDPEDVEELEAGFKTDDMSGPSLMPMDGIVLTDAGADRLRGASRDGDATDDLVILWAEDVVRPLVPSLCGIWWTESYEPENLSAPRGVVFTDAMRTMSVMQRRRWPEDEPDLPEEASVEVEVPDVPSPGL